MTGLLSLLGELLTWVTVAKAGNAAATIAESSSDKMRIADRPPPSPLRGVCLCMATSTCAEAPARSGAPRWRRPSQGPSIVALTLPPLVNLDVAVSEQTAFLHHVAVDLGHRRARA